MDKYIRVWKTVNEMLVDRGYVVKPLITPEELEETVTLGGWILEGTLSGSKPQPKTIGVRGCFLNVAGIREARTEAEERNLDRVILLSDNPSTPSATKLLSECGDLFETFSISELQFNITHHELYVKHTLLSSEEANHVLKKYHATLTHMPVILKTDAVARYMGLVKNQMVRITRKIGSQQPYYYYRVVSNTAPAASKASKVKEKQ